MPAAILTPEEIQAFRRENDLTQSHLAEKIGVSRRTVEEWEAARNTPPSFLRMAFSAMKANLEPWGIPLSTLGMERLREVRSAVANSAHKIKIYDFGDHIALQGGPSNSGNGIRIDKSSIEGSATELLNAFRRLESQLDASAPMRRS